MNSKKTDFHRDELDTTVRTALEDMLSQAPDDSRLKLAMRRLRNSSPSIVPAKGRLKRQYPRLLGNAVAAAFMLIVLWLGAQTETWAQVTLDFQRESTLERTTNVEANPSPIDTGRKAGAALRFVLILHAFGLLAGMVGMLTAWVCSMWRWLVAMWAHATERRRAATWCRRLHFAALVAYGIGIAFGCIWSQATWGGPWKWDPREGCTLITLGIGTMWYAGSPGDRVGNPTQKIIREAFVASLAFWLIVLVYALGGIYGARLHTYGFSSRLPTVITCVLAGNLLILLAASHWKKSSRRGCSQNDAM